MDLDDTGGGLGAETVYGTHEDSHVVMSEKVQSLAGSIYQEFERMIARYDEDVVKTLMPLLVNVLECLDAAYQVNQEHDVELELLREDNEQLVTQYEREKGGRKTAEQKLLELEDAAEGERKELTARLEALESIVRMLELKHKNSLEHTGRLEEREQELKKEYAKLHERYTELFKTHMDYMERTKLLLSGGQLSERSEAGGRAPSSRLQMGRSSGPTSFGFASLEAVGDGVDSIPTSPVSSCRSSPSLHSEMDNLPGGTGLIGPARNTMERSQETDAISLEHRGTVTSPGTPPTPNTPAALAPPPGKTHTRREQRSANTLYQELSFQDAEALADMDEGADITGSYVHPGEYASSVNDNFFGMGKEVENLIMENNELLATKNALNIVKDDLIVKVDELTGEQEMLREEIRTLNVAREKLRNRVAELEDEMKRLREAAEARSNAGQPSDAPDDEQDIPMAQRKRFTRVEMARVLMERNQYKERFMELQEAVRWTEMIRASRNDPLDKKSKQSIWKFFSNLFSSGDRPERPLVAGHLRYNAPTNRIAPGVRALPRPGQDFLDTDLGAGSERMVARRANERREQYRQVRAHVRKEDGRLQAYGWSLPGKVGGGPATTSSKSSSSGAVPVPVPVYCRPLAETTPGMKIWCAAGVNLMGGFTRDGGLMVGGSVFYSDVPPEPQIQEITINEDGSEVESLDRELNAGRSAALLETQLSSHVWICTSTHSVSSVTVIDANNPAEILDTFNVCNNHVLCIASVAGASVADYKDTTEVIIPPKTDDEESESIIKEGMITLEESEPLPTSVPTTQRSKSTEDVQVENGEEGEKQTEDHVEEKEEKEKMSSVLATMWLGAQNGALYIHSAVANWQQCLHAIKLKDSVVSIVQVAGRVAVALADGTVAIFRRNENGEWDLSKYHVVYLGEPIHSVRCSAAVANKVWCGYRNKIHVIDPCTLQLVHVLEAHPRKESQVRQLAWLGEGVWVSIRLDSTLRLYHAHTYQHLQDVDIEPYVSKMLGTGKLGFSFVRITALLISSNRLWIGTGNGVIISVPLNDNSTSNALALRSSIIGPGAATRVAQSPGSFVPFCTMAHAQLSFHGHRDVVKFFVAVPGAGGMSAASSPAEPNSGSTSPSTVKLPPAMLVMSGGEGYIDFRIGDGEMEDSVVLEEVEGDNGSGGNALDVEQGEQAPSSEHKGEKSHLIVWQVALS